MKPMCFIMFNKWIASNMATDIWEIDDILQLLLCEIN